MQQLLERRLTNRGRYSTKQMCCPSSWRQTRENTANTVVWKYLYNLDLITQYHSQ